MSGRDWAGAPDGAWTHAKYLAMSLYWPRTRAFQNKQGIGSGAVAVQHIGSGVLAGAAVRAAEEGSGQSFVQSDQVRSGQVRSGQIRLEVIVLKPSVLASSSKL
ncbi:predicted protein [Aspergillus nidulans FGSC A4]|uniref:Uncharacterized protein n=1 Tax=Emericella nidulans (strain FGSC A4 / ATCC 38163 / CBS 112.46 / NRRL 194 / M139) TaxID=227321 RepID=Q5B1V8_EMENI|nr:hypothetical protein [Aspergillus nidulans FGSC A4]EAA62632.1 predicted protein [Aspergillus nidulans FGSC A4]CBF81846.1 TPA: conserved hypothetical protein [Aspergillus nidulans FGSC A4]|eukprot:XP_663076.1 predicted protein [Aspergillus nidulans FGSC A4]